jgi:hypothetical protein
MTIGNGTVSGYYNSSANWTDLVIYLAAGGTTTYTSTGVTVSLPATATSVVPQNLPGKIYTGTQNFNAVLYISAGSGTGVILVPASTSATNLIAMSTASLTTGTNGNLSFVSSYWAA